MNRRRQRPGPVTVTCLTCSWTRTGGTWRPLRRALREHTAARHAELVR